MARIRKPAARKAEPLAADKIFQERRRVAERLISVFREAGYTCYLADDNSVGGSAKLPIAAKIH